MGKIGLPGRQHPDRQGAVGARREAVASGVRAIVFVGDAMEESSMTSCAKAGELGLLKVPVSCSRKGSDPASSRRSRERAPHGGADAGSIPALRRSCVSCLRAAAATRPAAVKRCCECQRPRSGGGKLIGQMK